jgi:hypothetical protein
MERGGRLRIQIEIIAVAFGLAVAGCARSAPALPVSYQGAAPDVQLTEAERAMTCMEIDNKLAAGEQKTKDLEGIIQGNRHDNQVIGYVAAITVPPLALLADGNSKEKEQLDKLQTERDRLYTVRRAKSCA